MSEPLDSAEERGANISSPRGNPAIEQLLGQVPELSARARGGRAMHRWLLLCVFLLGALTFLSGIDWGLPSNEIDAYLFGEAQPPSGLELSERVGARERWSASQPANVDVDATEPSVDVDWIDATATPEDRADILVRYRLYSHQPDEMTVFQAIRAMDPAARDFDPKMYQYGGLFLYPIAGLLKLGGMLGWVELTPDVAFYLDDPGAFARFYLVARGYVVLFGLLGILAAYRLGTALRDHNAGLIAALLFVLMPITINLTHEAKPHLPAAVLTLWAVYVGIRYMQRPSGGRLVGLSLLSGLAVGMVLAALSALSVIVVASFAARPTAGRMLGRLGGGFALAALAYLACNPYVAINVFQNPELLRQNFGNTGGMYSLGSVVDGAANVGRLVMEGAGPLLALAAILPIFGLAHRRTRGRLLMLGVPALLGLAWMIAVGANQPGEFGRFAVFADVVLLLAVAVEISRIGRRSRIAGGLTLLIFVCGTGFFGLRYLQQFRLDSTANGTRREAAAWLATSLATEPGATIGFAREPAPFAVPPMDFAAGRFQTLRPGLSLAEADAGPDWVISCEDRAPNKEARRGEYVAHRVFRAPPDSLGAFDTVISWANKPICVWRKQRVAE